MYIAKIFKLKKIYDFCSIIFAISFYIIRILFGIPFLINTIILFSHTSDYLKITTGIIFISLNIFWAYKIYLQAYAKIFKNF